MQIKVDEEFRQLIPHISYEELRGLEENIQADGCREPLVVWKGKDILLDGHNRLAICQKHNLHYDVQEIEFSSRDEAKIWIIRNQFGRRNLSQVQRLELVLVYEPLVKKQNKEKQIESGGDRGNQYTVRKVAVPHHVGEPPKQDRRNYTDYVLAEESGTSHAQVHRYRSIKNKAIEPLQEMVKTGEVSIRAGYHVSRMPTEEQESIVAKGPEAVKQAATQKPAPNKAEVAKQEPAQPHRRSSTPVIKYATDAMEFAVMAISQLKRIRKDDPLRIEALERVALWIKQQKQEK